MQPDRSFWSIVLTVSLFFGLVALVDAIPQLQSLNISVWRSKWTFLLLLFLANILLSMPLVWMIARGRFDNLFNRWTAAPLSKPWLVTAIIGIFLSLGGFWFIRLKVFAGYSSSTVSILLAFPVEQCYSKCVIKTNNFIPNNYHLLQLLSCSRERSFASGVFCMSLPIFPSHLTIPKQAVSISHRSHSANRCTE